MDWDKLRIFYAVAKAGSLTGAGHTLNISQSAISRQISTLEDSLGTTLFRRHARGLIMTEQGEMLYKTAQDMSGKLAYVEDQIKDIQNLPKGPLIITVSEFIGCTWLAPKIAEFRALYPEIQLTLLFDDKILDLNMKEADAAIRLTSPKTPDLIQRKLSKIRFHICGSKDYLAKHGRPKTLEDLKEHCIIVYPYGAISPFENPNWLLDLAQTDVQKSYNILFMNSMYAIQKAVSTGAGIAMMPDYLIRQDPDLEIILKEHTRPPVEMFFVYAKEQRNSKRTEMFRDFLLKNIQDMGF